MALDILICGAGITGPALAAFLAKSNLPFRITIVERTATLRTAGQQVDIRAQGLSVVRRAGLLDSIKAKCVSEAGVVFVDSEGREQARFGMNGSGRGMQSFTSQYEILRGDLVKMFYDASLQAVQNGGAFIEYKFGTWITDITQNSAGGVEVALSDGKTGRFDLLVAADGQRSRTRRMVLGEEEDEKIFDYKGLCIAYYSVPRREDDGDYARIYHVPGQKAVGTRSAANKPTTQAYMGVLGDNQHLRDSFRLSADRQKTIWDAEFRGSGWQTDRLLDEMKDASDFYALEIAQVKPSAFYQGRVAFVGDAGYCPSPITGMGTTAGLVGAYVLAGELARHGRDVGTALQNYNAVMRPFVDEIHKVPINLNLLYHQTPTKIKMFHMGMWAMSSLKIDQLITRFKPENKGGWEVPEYAELGMNGVW